MECELIPSVNGSLTGLLLPVSVVQFADEILGLSGSQIRLTVDHDNDEPSARMREIETFKIMGINMPKYHFSQAASTFSTSQNMCKLFPRCFVNLFPTERSNLAAKMMML